LPLLIVLETPHDRFAQIITHLLAHNRVHAKKFPLGDDCKLL